MIVFLISLILALVAVDLLVRFVVEPLISASKEKNKVSKTYSPRFDPTIKLATETMYDGGKPHTEEKSSQSVMDANKPKETNESINQ
ncbi:MAG: hypothetical protein KKB34_13440 [Bacteroidetes bacterium]|jgi:hypothetical protein|nr:hypothetical protein [Bacteroidota bacterium]